LTEYRRPAPRAIGLDPSLDINGPFFLSNIGLRLPQQISFHKWMGIGVHLSCIRSSSAWCLGDWLIYGETAFQGRYRDATEQTSLDYQTLRNYAWVARKFSMSRRRDNLSFAHHAEVAALSEPEQDFWLRKAEKFAWRVKHLRHEVRTSLRERLAEDEAEIGPGSSQDMITLRVAIPTDCLEVCSAMASRYGLNVDEWASQILIKALRESVVPEAV
jgi:hypothetical protein